MDYKDEIFVDTYSSPKRKRNCHRIKSCDSSCFYSQWFLSQKLLAVCNDGFPIEVGDVCCGQQSSFADDFLLNSVAHSQVVSGLNCSLTHDHGRIGDAALPHAVVIFQMLECLGAPQLENATMSVRPRA